MSGPGGTTLSPGPDVVSTEDTGLLPEEIEAVAPARRKRSASAVFKA